LPAELFILAMAMVQIFLAAQLLAVVAARCEVGDLDGRSCLESDGQGMLQLQGHPKTEETGEQEAELPNQTIGRALGSGREFEPNVWAPKFESTGPQRLQLSCRGASFLDCWNFYTLPDPTHGYLQYISKEKALELKLFKVEEYDTVYIGAGVGWSEPPKTIRLQSRNSFKAGHMFVIDIAHMPTGWGTWPAWWSTGPDWPNHGEIDMAETIHYRDQAIMALHTSPGCKVEGMGDCNKLGGITGCAKKSPHGSASVGFNEGGGGVFATEWTSWGIRMWVFHRWEIPADLAADQPDTSRWGKPSVKVKFGDKCPSWHFDDQIMVLNLAFCGDYAGEDGFDGGREACNRYVSVPAAQQYLKEAYWRLNYVKVFAAY